MKPKDKHKALGQLASALDHAAAIADAIPDCAMAQRIAQQAADNAQRCREARLSMIGNRQFVQMR